MTNLYSDDETLLSERIIIIPVETIEPVTLQAMIEEFVSRDGTDYGKIEKSLSEKANEIMGKLQLGEIKIIYDKVSKHVDFLPKDSHKKYQ